MCALIFVRYLNVEVERIYIMECNVGKTDKIVRVVLGVALVGYGAYANNWIIAGIGVVPLATAALGWCPVYLPFGFSTCKLKK